MFKIQSKYQKLYQKYRNDESKLKGLCWYCFNDIDNDRDLFSFLTINDILCGSCINSLKIYNKQVEIEQGLLLYACYKYNDFIEKMLFQFKESRDIALGKCFLYRYRKWISKRYQKYTIIFLPSSKNKTIQRGFIPLHEMWQEIKLNKIDPFYKKSEYKQSSKNMDERKQIKKIIAINEHIDIPKGKILIVDDVCTSGESMKQAYQLLPKKDRSYEGFVLAIHDYSIEKYEK